jgi:hypothetical protein
LLERVIRETRDAGFQEEKYEALYLRLRWDSESLMSLVNKRVSHLIRRRYQPKSTVGWPDVFPSSIKSESFDHWLVSRTLYRPRDIIAFVNEIIHRGGSSGINIRVCDAAESIYSSKRLDALAQEWYTDTKFLKNLAGCLKGMPTTFALSEIPQKSIENALLEIASHSSDRHDVVVDLAMQATVSDLPTMKARIRLVALLFHWGVVGVKVEAHKRSLFAFRDEASLSQNLITDATRVTVAPVFHRELGIVP